MPGLLISVRNLSESETVIDFLNSNSVITFEDNNTGLPIDILDVKEPSSGSLGRPSFEEVLEIVSLVKEKAFDQLKISVALGELIDGDQENWFAQADKNQMELLSRVNFWKVGLSQFNHSELTPSNHWPMRWDSFCKLLPTGSTPIPVIYFDYKLCNSPKPLATLKLIQKWRVPIVLFDTFNKSKGNLFNHIDHPSLEELAAQTTKNGLRTALAGSIGTDLLSSIFEFHPDWIGVRGAICADSRTGTIDSSVLKSFVNSFERLSRTHA